MEEKKKDERYCFKCGRYLGPKFEWRKMITEKGPICFKCFNEAQNSLREEETQKK